MKKTIPVLELPYYMRKTLSIPLSTLYISDKHEIKGLVVDYSVGDIVSRNMRSKYKVVDGKTKRTDIIKKPTSRKYITIVNPRGTISLNTRTLLKAYNIHGYFVKGEEDLIVIGIGCERKTRIVYGQPNIGVVVVDSNPYRMVNIIKTFKPNINVYD
ncbi:MAG: hypothetical protein B6U89_06580 [Desulfurococcales archaeon ex4484_58]|nr:MAG: hypothetical protein B6U89_06580 [Desulfurococcales archaeon ex4484_58]